MAKSRPIATIYIDRHGEGRWRLQRVGRVTVEPGEGFTGRTPKEAAAKAKRSLNAVLDSLDATGELTIIDKVNGEKRVGTRA